MTLDEYIRKLQLLSLLGHGDLPVVDEYDNQPMEPEVMDSGNDSCVVLASKF